MDRNFAPVKTEANQYYYNRPSWRSAKEKQYCRNIWRKMRVKIIEPYINTKTPILHRFPDGTIVKIAPMMLVQRGYTFRRENYVWGTDEEGDIPIPYMEGKDLEMFRILGKEAWILWKIDNGNHLKVLMGTKSQIMEILSDWNTRFPGEDGKHLLRCLNFILKATKRVTDGECDWVE